MIEILTKIHDKFALEFKMSFVTRRKLRLNDFSVYMWIFVPKSLDINQDTYPKNKFYQDLKSNVRLITPKFLLREIVRGKAVPLGRLKASFETLASTPTRTATAEFEYQIKMFAAIVKSATRDEIAHICSDKLLPGDADFLCLKFVENCRLILQEYRAARDIINTPTVGADVMDCYYFGDDFLSTIVQQRCIKLIRFMESAGKEEHREALDALYGLTLGETDYRRRMDYCILSPDDRESNKRMLFRFGVLKKYIESDLYLDAPKKKDGALVEQLYLSIAAGLAMVFATVVSFTFQQKFGNFTLPFFFTLVISYMLKDRIKELSRYYFAHKIGSKFFDNKASVRLKDEPFGTIKEGVDFIPESKVPEEVRRIRLNRRLVSAESRLSEDKVLLYRKAVHIDRQALAGLSDYDSPGLNDIVRLNVNSFLQKMDNPTVNVTAASAPGVLETVACDKVYYINIVLQMCVDESGKGRIKDGAEGVSTEYRRFRVGLTRDGIDSFEEVK